MQPTRRQSQAGKRRGIAEPYKDDQDGRFISFFGDLHPSYSGNVVKAMSSAKQGYPVVSGVLKRVKPTLDIVVVILRSIE